MPSSNPDSITHIAMIILRRNPSSFLDIGCGFGRWGFLAREFTDVCRTNYFDWQTRIDAIEIYEPYILDIHKSMYDNIYIGDCLDILPTLPDYDMMICGAMLEHLTEEDGSKLLDLIKEKTKYGIITTPINMSNQGTSYGNIHEKHLTQWTPKMLSNWGHVSNRGRVQVLEIVK